MVKSDAQNNDKVLPLAQKRDLLLGLTGGYKVRPWYIGAGVAVASIVGLALTVRGSFPGDVPDAVELT